VLALDVGSSSYKGCLARTGRVVRRAAVAAPRGAAPGEVLAALRGLVAELLDGGGRPECAVVTGQMGSHVWVDGDGRAAGDVVPWTDRRDASAQARLCAAVDPAAFHRATGQRVPGLAARHAWGAAAGRTGVPVPLRQWLLRVATGVWGIDPTDASVTGALDIHEIAWSEAWRLGVPDGSRPPVRDPRAVMGRVTAEGARALGIPEGVPVLTGAGDGPCASLGARAAGAAEVAEGVEGAGGGGGAVPGGAGGGDTGGVGCLTLGSSATLRMVTTGALLDPGARSTVLAWGGGAYVLSIPVSNAGFALEWGRRVLGFGTAEAFEEAAAAGRTDPGVIVLPYVTGERFPYWSRGLRAGVYGAGEGTDRATLARSVVVGIACTLLRTLRHARELGADPRVLMVNGGAAASGSLLAATAALLGRDGTEIRTCAAGSLEGALALGGVRTPRAAAAPVRPDAGLAADPALADEIYRRFVDRSDRAAGA
jgi:sugar (pentulose or hexulose) kinase